MIRYSARVKVYRDRVAIDVEPGDVLGHELATAAFHAAREAVADEVTGYMLGGAGAAAGEFASLGCKRPRRAAAAAKACLRDLGCEVIEEPAALPS